MLLRRTVLVSLSGKMLKIEARFRTICFGVARVGVDGDCLGLFGGEDEGLESLRTLPKSWAGFGIRVFFGELLSGSASEDNLKGSYGAPAFVSGWG